MGVGVPGHVEPVPGHFLAVMRARHQPIDESLVGVGGRVCEKDLDLVTSGRESGECEGDPPDQGGPIGLGIDGQPLSGQTRLDEAVDSRGNTGHFRRDWPREWTERPVLFIGGP